MLKRFTVSTRSDATSCPNIDGKRPLMKGFTEMLSALILYHFI